MKKDKKKDKSKPRKEKPSQLKLYLLEWWSDIKYYKLYYSTIFLIGLVAFLSLYFQYTYERQQRHTSKEEVTVTSRSI